MTVVWPSSRNIFPRRMRRTLLNSNHMSWRSANHPRPARTISSILWILTMVRSGITNGTGQCPGAGLSRVKAHGLWKRVISTTGSAPEETSTVRISSTKEWERPARLKILPSILFPSNSSGIALGCGGSSRRNRDVTLVYKDFLQWWCAII